jgi:PEP-CTERM motif
MWDPGGQSCETSAHIDRASLRTCASNLVRQTAKRLLCLRKGMIGFALSPQGMTERALRRKVGAKMNIRSVVLSGCVALAFLSGGVAKADLVSLTLIPNSIDFGDVALNAGGGHVFGSAIVVQTSGAGSFDLNPLFALPAPYSVTSGSCSSTIAGGSACSTTSVRLNTSVAGVYDDVLTLDFTFHPATGGSPIIVPEILTLSANVGAVPEPSTWAMALVGFAGLGYVGYRRGRRQRASVAS